MIRRASRLGLTLYLVSLAQVAAIIASVALVFWLAFGPPPGKRGPPPRGPGPHEHHRPPNPLFFIVPISLVATGVASALLARSLAKPLGTLTSVARAFGAGDLTARARLDRKDELGQLSEAFDEMAERIADMWRAQQELLANVSHELRTPLARIHVALDLAAEGDAATAQEALSEIGEDLSELERLVADVLKAARLDLTSGRAGSPLPPIRAEKIEARALLDRSIQRFHSMHPERALEVAAEEALPDITGDQVLLRRAIDNLLDNACQYSEAEVKLCAKAAEGVLEVTVDDRGIGIAAEDLPRVTTPFFRTDRSRQRRTGGLGLGLSLARRIVEAHGGSLRIESELGVGTHVHVLLPATARRE